jgi:hypothetical protein
MNDVNSFSFWENPVLLTTCVLGNEPTASGDSDGALEIDPREIGRHESAKYDPSVDSSEDDGLELHIPLPSLNDGDYIAYATFYGESFQGVIGGEEDGYENSQETMHNAALVFTFEDNGEDDRISVDLTSRTLSDNSLVFGESYENEGADGGEYLDGEAYVDYGEGSFGGWLEKETWQIDDSENIETGRYTEVDEFWGGMDTIEEEEIGLFLQFIYGVIEYNDVSWVYNISEDSETYEGFEGYGEPYFGGVVTPLQDIQALIASDVVLSYSGFAFQTHQDVEIDVDFGNETFSGSFTGNAGYETDMSFTASGDLRGQHLVSTSVSADSGYVQATFIGSNAAGLTGVYEVTKGEATIGSNFIAIEDSIEAFK